LLRLLAAALSISAGLAGAGFDWSIPKGFPRPAVPADNPMTAEKVELGRYLFYDKRMSVNGKESCGSCHRQELAFTDGRARAEGATGELHPRGAMSLVNVAYAPSLTWADPTITSLEAQALIPMLGQDPLELGLRGHETAFLNTLRHDPIDQRLFPLAFPGQGDIYTLDNVTKAIASFERTIISMRSPYDRYRWDGDSTAISPSAKRGELLFFSSEKARCFQCHDGWNFSSVKFEGSHSRDEDDRRFFNTGVTLYMPPNRGLFESTRRPEDIGKFRAPTLRNIAVTAPYMHDGSLTTLDAVIDHYSAGGKLDHPNKSRILRPLQLTADEKRDLIEFLKSLTDEALLRDPSLSDPWKK
jgi:cytochrome c peroxidase